MRAKSLEVRLGSELKIGEAEMVQRFQRLRESNLLPTSRGRNAEDITYDAVVSGLLSIVDERPGYAGQTTRILRGLRPVGTVERAFAGAASFAEALSRALQDKALLDSLVEIRISCSEIYTNSNGRGVLVYEQDGEICTTYYLGSTAVSQFQPGKELEYNPRALINSMIRETVIFPRILQRISQEMADDARYARMMAVPVGSFSAQDLE